MIVGNFGEIIIKNISNNAVVDLFRTNAVSVFLTTTAGAIGTTAPVLQESDDGTTFTNVAAADIRTQKMLPTGSPELWDSDGPMIGYLGDKQFIRLSTGTGIALCTQNSWEPAGQVFQTG